LHQCHFIVELDPVGPHSAGTDGRPKSSDAGESDAGLEDVDTALRVDPDHRAAQLVRECMVSAVVDDPPASADGYAQLEQRVRRRRVDKCVEAARAALAQHRFDDAAATLDELIELDPGLPILGELTAELNQRRDAAASRHRGPWIAEAAVCALALALFALLTSSSQRFGPLISHRLDGSTLTVAPTLPASVQPSTVVAARPRRSEALVEQDRLSTVSAPRPAGFAGRDESGEPPQPAPEPLPPVPEQAAAVASPPAPISASIPTDDEALIRQTLRRYRDAIQAHSLVFDACQMEVRGSSAMAICRGAARYVPKFGRREPRTERRVWSFTLNKHDGDWTIETARTDQ
jgi:hypothetical protein